MTREARAWTFAAARRASTWACGARAGPIIRSGWKAGLCPAGHGTGRVIWPGLVGVPSPRIRWTVGCVMPTALSGRLHGYPKPLASGEDLDLWSFRRNRQSGSGPLCRRTFRHRCYSCE